MRVSRYVIAVRKLSRSLMVPVVECGREVERSAVNVHPLCGECLADSPCCCCDSGVQKGAVNVVLLCAE